VNGYYLFSPNSLAYARSRLASLAATKYLHRFRLPSPKTGGTELIYTLGSRGRDFIANELGLPVDWYFRPGKHLYYAQCQHNLLLTRFCVAAHSFCRKQTCLPTGKTDLRLVEMRLCYEFARQRATVEKLKVVPDAYLVFERLRNDVHEHFMPLWIEIDRGTEQGRRFREHLSSRIAFIQSSSYRELFHTNAVVIAYVTIGDKPEYGETRRKAMCRWTMEVLTNLHLQNWSHLFHYTSVECGDLYSTPIFSDPVWYRPNSPEPVPLFAS
jgi:Replication-relaxation